MPTSNFQPIRLLDPDCYYKFIHLMANSVYLDKLASSEANWSGSTLFAKAGYIRVLVTLSVEVTFSKCFASLPKRSHFYIRKEFAPSGSKFVPCNVDPFSGVAWCAKGKLEVTKFVSPCKIVQVYPAFLSRFSATFNELHDKQYGLNSIFFCLSE